MLYKKECVSKYKKNDSSIPTKKVKSTVKSGVPTELEEINKKIIDMESQVVDERNNIINYERIIEIFNKRIVEAIENKNRSEKVIDMCEMEIDRLQKRKKEIVHLNAN